MKLEVSTIVKNNFKIVKEMAHGGMAKTFVAVNQNDNKKVILKLLLFTEMKEWKTLELFEREVKTLKNLSHSNIPKYVDDFTTHSNDNVYYFLVQEYIEGDNLFDHIHKGKKFKLHEVMGIFQSLLYTLKYIHTLFPAIIHRDIQPKNIILTPNNKVYLVDFGSVGQMAKDTLSARNTFVGTIGYFPQEQLMGKVTPSSDLYALAMTLIYITTAKDPVDMQLVKGKVYYHPYANIPNHFKQILDQMIEPFPEDRIQSAEEVLDRLLNKRKSKVITLKNQGNFADTKNNGSLHNENHITRKVPWKAVTYITSILTIIILSVLYLYGIIEFSLASVVTFSFSIFTVILFVVTLFSILLFTDELR